MLIDTTVLPATFEVTRCPAQLVFAGATAVALEIWNGVAWQAANDQASTPAAITLTGVGNLALTLPGSYRLTGTALTTASIYKAVS